MATRIARGSAEPSLAVGPEAAVQSRRRIDGFVARRVPTARARDSLAQVRAAMVGETWDLVEIVVVIDEDRRVQAVVDTRDLLAAADPAQPVADLARPWPVIDSSVTPERAALTAHRHNVSVLPVAGDDGVLVGCLRGEALMDVLWHEHAEDLHRFAGLQRETRGARRAFLLDSPLQRLRKRAPWLLAGAIGSTFATSLMASFEAALAVDVSIAFFIPAIVYLADAVGTQTEAIAVRGLTLEHRKLGHAIVREAATGLLIGVLLGLLAFLGVLFIFGNGALALAVSLSLVAASAFASIFGVVLPWLLDRAGFDPAFGAGPLATIVQDLASILLYLSMVRWLML
ncbi:magnesium transporter [Sphingobium indicum]|nr:magnesium transporter [Sphingobium indicum]